MAETIDIPKRKKKTNSVLSVVGVTIVLLLMGVMGWFFINLKATANSLKEQVEVAIYLNVANKDTIAQIQRYVATQPYAKNVRYIDKDKAKAIWNKDNNEQWDQILDSNPLPESINFYANAAYVNPDSLSAISNNLTQHFGNLLSSVDYPKNLVGSMNDKVNKLGLIFLVIAIGLGIIVVISIDNTIKLTMFSNRFTIKTMQLVGATRDFIAFPMIKWAIINGLISAIIAIIILFILTRWAISRIPDLFGSVHNSLMDYLLYLCMIVLGVLISWISTYRSVNKYLKSRLDDLY